MSVKRRLTVGRMLAAVTVLSVVALAGADAMMGPPPMLDPGSVDLGVEVGTIERDVVMQGTVGGALIQRRVLNSTQATANLRVGYAIGQNFQARVLLGGSRLNLGQFDWNGSGVPLGQQDMDGDMGLMWGLGGEYVVWPLASAPDVRVGVSGEYRRYTSEIERGEFEMDEIRAALKVAWPLDRLTVYGGPLYSDLSGTFEGVTSLGFRSQGRLDADNKAGVLVGAEYQFNPRLLGRLEGEFISSTGINLSFIYGLGGPVGRTMDRPVQAPASPPAPSAAARPAPSAVDYDEPPPPRRRAGVPEAPPAQAEVAVAEDGRRVKPPTPPPGTRARRSEPEESREGVVPAASVTVPSNVDELIAAGNDLAGLGRYDEAISFYRRAVAADPREFRAIYNLATAQYLVRDYAGARASYEDAVTLRPADAESHLFLGFCHYRLQRPEAAARSWRRVLEIEPGNAVALNNLQALGY